MGGQSTCCEELFATGSVSHLEQQQQQIHQQMLQQCLHQRHRISLSSPPVTPSFPEIPPPQAPRWPLPSLPSLRDFPGGPRHLVGGMRCALCVTATRGTRFGVCPAGSWLGSGHEAGLCVPSSSPWLPARVGGSHMDPLWRCQPGSCLSPWSCLSPGARLPLPPSLCPAAGARGEAKRIWQAV